MAKFAEEWKNKAWVFPIRGRLSIAIYKITPGQRSWSFFIGFPFQSLTQNRITK